MVKNDGFIGAVHTTFMKGHCYCINMKKEEEVMNIGSR